MGERADRRPSPLPPSAWKGPVRAGCSIPFARIEHRLPPRSAPGRGMRRLVTHEQALTAIRATLETAPGPVSIAVVDDHGEIVACLAMDGAARDTLENARRKAYTAARSDATSTRALAEKMGEHRRSSRASTPVLVLPRRRGRILRRPSRRCGRRQRASGGGGRAPRSRGDRRGGARSAPLTRRITA